MQEIIRNSSHIKNSNMLKIIRAHGLIKNYKFQGVGSRPIILADRVFPNYAEIKQSVLSLLQSVWEFNYITSEFFSDGDKASMLDILRQVPSS